MTRLIGRFLQKFEQSEPGECRSCVRHVKFLHAAAIHHHERGGVPICKAGKSRFEGYIKNCGDQYNR